MPKSLSSFTQVEIRNLWKSARLKIRKLGIILLVAPKQGTNARLLTITPRTSGAAPKRNLIRRRLRAIFREEKLNEQGYDVIVKIAKEGIATPYLQLKELLLKAVALD